MAVTLAGGRPRVGGGRPPAGLWRNLLLGGQSWACLVPRPAARAVATGRGEGSRRKVEGAGGRGGRREEKERNEQGKAGTSPSHRLSPSLPLPCGQLRTVALTEVCLLPLPFCFSALLCSDRE